MSALILRVVGTLVALVGLVGVVLGGWFLDALGTSGTATFSGEPGQRIVVLDQHVLNRVDSPVTVTASGTGELWAGTARPSDAEAVLTDARRAGVSGVDVSDWALESTKEGTKEPTSVRGPDVWQSTTSTKGEVTVTITQEAAPQTLVVTAPEGETVDQLEIEVTDERWSTIAIVVLATGVVLLLLGIALGLAPRLRARRPHRATHGRREGSA